MLLLIAAIGTTWMACDEGRQALAARLVYTH
jgi:hypothetical protein